MSSSVTRDSIDGVKLLVHIAENGHSFEVECSETTTTDAIMRFIQSVSGIDFNDQLVLCSEMKLEPHRPLSTYKLPSDDREVFVFNKARLQSNCPPPPLERVDILEVAGPPSPSSSHKHHPLDDAMDPALKALPSYERQFRYHYHSGNLIYSRSQLRYENCQRLYKEHKVQEKALEVARANLEQYYKTINQNFSEFMKRYLQQHRVHSDLLANYGRDIDRLRSIKLHPALQSVTRKCLLDFVKEENLRKLAENCVNSHRQFENKVSQFKQMFGEVKRRVEDVLASKTSLSVRNLELTIREHQQYINEQRSIMQSLSKDVNTVKKLVDDCLSGHLSSSLRPHDAVSALGPMYDVHDKNHLPKIQACDRSICKLLDFCKDKKNEMNIFVHNYMQRIAYVSYIIKDARLQFPVFREAMVRQDDLFMELKLVRGIGPAYRACLAEVVRRKASMKLYMGLAGQLAERLAIKREAEVRRREEFLKEQSSFIPGDILASMGLYDTPSQCDVNIAPFDTNLLNVDISDLYLYAPDYLAGIPLEATSMESPRHSCLKLELPNPCEPDKVEPVFIKGTWFDTHFVLSITNGLDSWVCIASEEEVRERAAQWDQPVAVYIELAERYLGFQQPGSVYKFSDAGNGQRRLSWTFEKEGTKLEWRWKCQPSPAPKQTVSGILDFLMDANIRLSEEVVSKTKSFERLKVEAEKCLAQSERFSNEKTEFESAIYAKFLSVLNSKKGKLREIREQLVKAGGNSGKSPQEDEESTEKTVCFDEGSDTEVDNVKSSTVTGTGTGAGTSKGVRKSQSRGRKRK